MLKKIFIICNVFFCYIFSHSYSAPYSELLIVENTNKVLFAKNIHEKRYPASLTKAMLAYVVFKRIKDGKININKKIVFSKNATMQIPSKLGLKVGSQISLYTALQALFVKSANDVAYAVAESVFGSVKACVFEMNCMAKILGMKNTVYFNPSGVPDRRQSTTAHDQLILARSLYNHFGNFKGYFKAKNFVCNGKMYKTHNHLLFHPGVDGLKTGYIDASGYNIITSAVRNVRGKPVRLFGVVIGGETHSKRDARVRKMIDLGYKKLEKCL